MDSALFSMMKQFTLRDIQKVIDSFGDLAKSSLATHSLVMVINNSGETTFTSCGWKLLAEAGFNHPLAKVISNAALTYTKVCGEDCKYFLFILKEIFSIVHNKVNGNDEAYARRCLINEISSLKRTLPCVFKAIQDISDSYMIESNPTSFVKDLNSIVLTFMLSRFSKSVSKILSNLICDFICKINTESFSLKLALEYIISHFDIFCCKMLSSVSESKILEGFVLYKRGIPSDLNIKNCKFIIVWDLSMKLEIQNISWKITDESFMSQLDPFYINNKVFEYFKSQNILVILTPSVGNNNIKFLCEKNGIFLVDRLEKEEIECILACFDLYALESLDDKLEPIHIGNLDFAKSFSFNKSHFIHLICRNSIRLFTVYHIQLAAPCNAIWKEYYSECLNCFKMIYQWLNFDFKSSLQKTADTEILSSYMHNLPIHDKNMDFCICAEIKISSEYKSKIASLNVIKSDHNSRMSLAPGLWELLLKIILGRIPKKLALTFSTVLQAVDFAIAQALCNRVGVQFTDIKDIEGTHAKFVKKCKIDGISCLEPVVCKEMMMSNILDLLLHLLRIESIVLIHSSRACCAN